MVQRYGQCKDCRHFVKEDSTCRACPPNAASGGEAVWPVVMEDDGCAAYKSNGNVWSVYGRRMNDLDYAYRNGYLRVVVPGVLPRA